MMGITDITSVTAMQASTDQRHPAVKVTVTTANGAAGSGSVYESYSTSRYRPRFLYDGSETYRGLGVTTAAAIINKQIAPALIGLPADRQPLIDSVIKSVIQNAGLGDYVNISSPVSVAALKAGAQALDIPLYRHMGGRGAFTIPAGGHLCASGSKRYNPLSLSRGRPVYNMVSYGFDTFAGAHYALWETTNAYEKLLAEKYSIRIHRGFSMAIPPGKLENDFKLWDILRESIEAAGYTGKIGIHVDVGANEYYDAENGTYRGLFSAEDKDRGALFKLYEKMIAEYPVVIIQDPFNQDDVEGYAALVKSTGVQITGADVCGANVERIKQCVNAGAVNSVLLPLCNFSTVSDAVEVVRYVKNHGMDVMPQNLSGEGLDTAHYAAGFKAGTVYQGGIDPVSNHLIAIEQDIGARVRFYGIRGLQGSKFSLKQQ
jgi:enolase